MAKEKRNALSDDQLSNVSGGAIEIEQVTLTDEHAKECGAYLARMLKRGKALSEAYWKEKNLREGGPGSTQSE